MEEENRGLEDFLSRVDQVGKYSTKEFILRLYVRTLDPRTTL